MTSRPTTRLTGRCVRSALACSGLLATALAARPAAAQYADPAFPVVDGRVYSSAIYGNRLYVGGQFQHVGPNTGSFACLEMGSGAALPFARIDGTVYAIASDSEGGWFVGGEFSSVSGLPRANLARIRGDGSVDPNWNPGADGPVRALVSAGSFVYVGGDFLTAGGQSRRHVAALNHFGGEAFAWDADADSAVLALAFEPGKLWMGGRFANVGGQPRVKIAVVNSGTAAPLAWSTTIGTWPGQWPKVIAIALQGSDVFVAGQFTSIGGQSRSGLAALDASSGLATGWDPMGAGNLPVYSILPRGATVLLGGSFSVMGGQPRANLAEVSASTGIATAWNPGANGNVQALTLANGHVLAGGNFSTAGGAPRANLAALDLATGAATSWDPGAHGSVLAIAQGPFSPDTSLVAVGGQRMSMGAVARVGLAAFDLDTGQLDDWNPGTDGWVRSLSMKGSVLYVAGPFTQIDGLPRNGLAAFDVGGSPQTTTWAPGSTAGGTIECIHAHGNTVYIGGGFTTVGGVGRDHIAAFDAASGALTGWNPGANNWVRTIAAKDGRVFVGGSFSALSNVGHAYLGAVDSATALALPWQSDAENVVDFVVPDDQGHLYVGGWFTSLGGAPRLRIGRVTAANGALDAWNPGASAPVEAIVPSGPIVYAGGFFQTIGGVTARGAAVIDDASGVAQSWDPGLVYSPWTIAVSNGVVYAGGDLYSAGTLPLSGIAKLFPADAGPPVPQLLTPNGGEHIWGNFEPFHVTWTATDDQRAPWVDLEYSTAGPAGPWSNVATALPNTGAFDWLAPLVIINRPARASAPTPAWLRVVAHDLAGNSGADVCDGAFFLPDNGDVHQPPVRLSLSVSPSPVRGLGHVLLGIPAATRVRVGLYDIAGREVSRLADGPYGAGPQAFAMPAGLAPGVYVVRAVVGDAVLARKFVLLN